MRKSGMSTFFNADYRNMEHINLKEAVRIDSHPTKLRILKRQGQDSKNQQKYQPRNAKELESKAKLKEKEYNLARVRILGDTVEQTQEHKRNSLPKPVYVFPQFAVLNIAGIPRFPIPPPPNPAQIRSFLLPKPPDPPFPLLPILNPLPFIFTYPFAECSPELYQRHLYVPKVVAKQSKTIKF